MTPKHTIITTDTLILLSFCTERVMIHMFQPYYRVIIRSGQLKHGRGKLNIKIMVQHMPAITSNKCTFRIFIIYSNPPTCFGLFGTTYLHRYLHFLVRFVAFSVYWVSFPRVNQPRCGVNHPTQLAPR